jgi:AraC-like DNA-binding protein
MSAPGSRRTPPGPVVPEILVVGQDRALKNGNEKPGRCASDILSVYVRGGPRYELDGLAHVATPPFAILIPQGTTDHDVQAGEVDGVFTLFRGNGLLRRAGPGHVGIRVSADTPPAVAPFLRHLSAAEAVALQDLLRRIAGASPHRPQGLLLRSALLLEAVALYCGRERRSTGRGVHREARRLRDLIDAHAFEPAALSRLYRDLGVSSAQAATLFARAYGLPPVAYRLQVRLNRARELLVSTRRNVRETAWEVGFSDPLYFSRVFARRFGTTPSSLIREFAVTRKMPPGAAAEKSIK